MIILNTRNHTGVREAIKGLVVSTQLDSGFTANTCLEIIACNSFCYYHAKLFQLPRAPGASQGCKQNLLVLTTSSKQRQCHHTRCIRVISLKLHGSPSRAALDCTGSPFILRKGHFNVMFCVVFPMVQLTFLSRVSL